VAMDPNLAAGYAVLAQTYVNRLVFIAPEEQKLMEQKAYVAVEKALSLDPDLAEAYLARGIMLWTPSNRFPHERAMQEFRRSLALNPNSDEVHRQLARVYEHIGLLDEALQEAQKAIAINPSAGFPLLHTAEVLLWQGQYKQALAVWQSIPMETHPSHVGSQIAWTLLQLGRREEAWAKVEKFMKDYPEDAGGSLAGVQAVLFAAAGQLGKAQDSINRAAEEKEYGHFHHTAYSIACAYVLMNKPQAAVQWLQESADNGFPCYPLFERDPNLDSLRKDPRFITFMDGLKRQWEHYKATLGTGSG
jgi:tetratricopeptide (TPR) repeat protein